MKVASGTNAASGILKITVGLEMTMIEKIVLGVGCLVLGFTAQAQTPVSPAAKQVLKSYLEITRKEKPNFSGFDAKIGERLYYTEREHSKKGDSRSCAVCHGDDPGSIGQHITSGKTIEPLTPSTNPERLTDAKKIEKWFRRNCKWTLERSCTTEEKGHFLTFLYSF